MENLADTLHCVFNVKKRSWKAGIQVAIHLTQEAIAAARARTQLNARLAALPQDVPEEERDTIAARAEELCVVELARLVLQAALERGLPQDNCVVEAYAYEELLSSLGPSDGARILQHICEELDLPRPDTVPAAP